MTAAPTPPWPDRIALLETPGFAGYALLDSGGGRKLERFGDIVVDRPEPQALWQPRLDRSRWQQAHAVFSASGEDDEKGRWRTDRTVPESWPVILDTGPGPDPSSVADPRPDLGSGSGSGLGSDPGAQRTSTDPASTAAFAPAPAWAPASSPPVRATMHCRLSAMWHLGLFPEQMPHWQWMVARLQHARQRRGRPPRLLNLFGYTGAASLLAAAMGAEVTHVDASKKAMTWARDNQAASHLGDAKIRWLVDDATKFAAREIRRGRTYDMILVDPPKFGRGPDGEIWDLFTSLPKHLDDLGRLLDPQGGDLVLTVYAIRASTMTFAQLLAETLAERNRTLGNARLEAGELAIRETGGPPAGARLVPTSLYARWSDGDA